MQMNTYFTEIITGLLLPFAGTALGAAAVFMLNKNTGKKTNSILSGFAAGIMTAASVWSLLLPAAELATDQGIPEWLPCFAGFSAGVLFIVLTDIVADRIMKRESRDGNHFLLAFAVTLHNIPEGMAVGAALAGMTAENPTVTTASAMSLCIGIAIQNIPEGAVISAPLCAEGKKKTASFILGMLSGAVEPVGAILTLVLTSLILPALSYLLAFAAGAMIYTVFCELAPEIRTKESGISGALGASAGFALMMLLDIAFS